MQKILYVNIKQGYVKIMDCKVRAYMLGILCEKIKNTLSFSSFPAHFILAVEIFD